MLAVERLKKIENLVAEKSFLTICELVAEMKVSESTIRRDIESLEKENKLIRSHGGVMAAEQANFNLVASRENRNIGIKRAIGMTAVSLIQEGDSVFFDSSTTVLEVVKNLNPAMQITAVTDDLVIALELERKNISNIVVLGGTLRNGTHSLMGTIAEANIGSMFFTKVFIGAGGISLEGHVMNYNLQASELRKKTIAMSDKVILVTDDSKFYKKAFTTVVTLDKINTIVTNDIPANIRQVLDELGVSIILCSGEQASI
jgi:DeoR/GlpR family transcriptional regulator of sugar metabolism